MKTIYLVLAFLALIGMSSSAFSFQYSEEEYLYLDRLALEAGTNRSSAFHNYTKVYARYLASLKEESIRFLEIGIGDSVKLWEAYFPKAELHFVDSDPTILDYMSTRSKYHHIDLSNTVALRDFVREFKSQFDFILECGNHQMHQQIICLKTLFPYLRRGGLYIIENLHTSYWHSHVGKGSLKRPQSGPGTMLEYLKALVDDMNYVGARTQCADHSKISPELKKELSYFHDRIGSIHFYNSMCIIIKK